MIFIHIMAVNIDCFMLIQLLYCILLKGNRYIDSGYMIFKLKHCKWRICNASRPLLRCRPRAQYEVHELPLFVEKSRSCRVVQERALVQHEQVASKKNSLHEHTRALYVIATRRLFYDELNAMSLGWRCDENQFNIFFN